MLSAIQAIRKHRENSDGTRGIKKKGNQLQKATNLYKVWVQRLRRSRGCTAWHITLIDVTPWSASNRHVSLGTKSFKFSTLRSTCLFTSYLGITARLRGHCGPLIAISNPTSACVRDSMTPWLSRLGDEHKAESGA